MNLLSDIFHIITNISWAADTVSTIVSVFIGMIWYSSMIFGTAWMELTGLKEKTGGTNHLTAMLWHVPIAFLISANIAAFCKHFEYDTPAQAFLIGYDLGLIACLLLAVNYFYEQKPIKLFLINAGYIIVSTSAMGMVIGALI